MTDIRLSDCSILVIEDEFLLAHDVAQTLEEAGATVLGPLASAADALELMAGQLPDCVLLDVNLGGGPDFALAATLLERNIPFVLMTGYDAAMVPDEFATIPRLQKPMEPPAILDAAARCIQRRD